MVMPRSTNYPNSLDATRAAGQLVNYTHPDYRYHKPDWDMMRDAMAGERRVKEMGLIYLPPLGDNAGTSYDAYKARAAFVNMTARTVNALVGTIYRRTPKINGLRKSDKQTKQLEAVSPDGASVHMFSRIIASELAQVGRVGVLVDVDRNGVNPPYLTYYMAENILSWKTEMRDGREVLTYVLLREVVEEMMFMGVEGSTAPEEAKKPRVRKNGGVTVVSRGQTYKAGERPVLRDQYRVLLLENGVYKQKVFTVQTVRGATSISNDPDYTTVPNLRGAPLDFIPFAIVGTRGVSAKVTRSPMMDICSLNMAHYRSSAQLEHGRYFTALPVYYVPVGAGDRTEGEYTVGPSVVWEVQAGEKPGILEYYGTGLRELAASLLEKENHIAQLGGRVIGFQSAGQGSQSPEVAALTQASEVAVLTLLCDAVSAAMTRILRWWAIWTGMDKAKADKIEYILNRDYATGQIGAREMRSIALLYQSGILPISEVYRIFQEAELISPTLTEAEFVEILNDINQFPNQPDVKAMRDGYKDANAQLNEQLAGDKNETAVEVAQIAADATVETTDANNAAAQAQQRADQQHQQNVLDRQHSQRMQQQESAQKAAQKATSTAKPADPAANKPAKPPSKP